MFPHGKLAQIIYFFARDSKVAKRAVQTMGQSCLSDPPNPMLALNKIFILYHTDIYVVTSQTLVRNRLLHRYTDSCTDCIWMPASRHLPLAIVFQVSRNGNDNGRHDIICVKKGIYI